MEGIGETGNFKSRREVWNMKILIKSKEQLIEQGSFQEFEFNNWPGKIEGMSLTVVGRGSRNTLYAVDDEGHKVYSITPHWIDSYLGNLGQKISGLDAELSLLSYSYYHYENEV
jgi:hypothetical protein